MKLEKLISDQEGEYLLKLARYALQSSQNKICTLPNIPSSISTALQETRGIFVGLWNEGKLRGCIGSPFPKKPLGDAVVEYTIMSTKEGSRPPPLSPEEISHIQIEISVLTPPQPIQYDQIQLGVHGLLIYKDNRSGFLLPQGALDNRYTVITFLEQTCLRGGLPKDAWKEGALINAFKVQIFKEQPQ